MSTVHPFPIPELLLFDWALVFCGLGTSVGVLFELIRLSADKQLEHRVYTLTNCWLILSGVIHSWIEFQFTFYRSNSSIKPALDLYAAGDYRYGDYGGMMESGTTAMEAITALIDGPLCILVAYAAVHDHSYRYPLQIVLCVMQLYGLTWFTLQPMFSDTGLAGHFSSDPVLFWGVAVGCNAPWAIFPSILLVDAFYKCCKSFQRPKSIVKK